MPLVHYSLMIRHENEIIDNERSEHLCNIKRK